MKLLVDFSTSYHRYDNVYFFLQKFNPDALVAEFRVENQKILNIYKMTDLSFGRLRKAKDDLKKEKQFEMPKSVDDLMIRRPKIDTCVVVTDTSVYKIILK